MAYKFKKQCGMIILLLSCFSCLNLVYAENLSASKDSKHVRIYIAAALFNSRETRFNLDVVRQLEAKNYKTLFPQRDGFESERLVELSSVGLSRRDAKTMSSIIIYLYDLGVALAGSNIVVANLDEPLDPGVVVEITFARLIGKPVIGFRTDSRSPYGEWSDRLGGTHFFVGYQCNYFVRQVVESKTQKDARIEMQELMDKILVAIRQVNISSTKTIPQFALNNPGVVKILDSAKLLFKGVDEDIHTRQGLEIIVKRYKANKPQLDQIRPQVIE
jgi:nucleoside 2-deoxyribosyltransferase